MDEKCARPTGRIEHPNARQLIEGRRHADALPERHVRDPIDECVRRVKSARGSPRLRRHERFEGAAEHLRIDGGLREGRGLLERGEAIAGEQLAEKAPACFVVEPERSQAALDGRWREQTAIQEWNAPESSRWSRPFHSGCIQRPEEERKQHAAMELPTILHAAVEGTGEETWNTIQPALALEKPEKQQPRAV